MPSALKLAAEFGEDLGIIFAECQGATFDQMERFVWDQGWMGNHALWSLERPVQMTGDGLPHYVLLSAEGRVLSSGHPESDHSKIVDLIEAELKSAGRVPKDTPKELEKAWKEFNAGKWAKGIELARTLGDSGTPGAEAAQELSFVFEARVTAKVARVERMLEQGCFADATARLGELEKKAVGVAAVAERLTKLRETLASDATKKEAEAEAALLSMLEKCYEDGLDEKAAKRLAKLAETHTGTKAAERALRLSRL